MSKRFKKIIVVTVVVLLVFLAILFFLLSRESENSEKAIKDDYVTVLDVGQGDCSIISSNGKNFLVDTGTGSNTESIVTSLKDMGIKNLDVLSISHFHEDHTGGLSKILDAFSVSNIVLPKETVSTNLSSYVLKARDNLVSGGTKSYSAKQGMTIDVGDFEVTVLYVNNSLSGENNHSVYMMAQKDGIKFLFTGDGEQAEEKLLLNEGLNLDCDVLKVPHHGGRGSSSKEFLEACTPKYSAISVGTGNMYSHPHSETISRLKEVNSTVYRTDEDGDICFYVTDGNLSVETEK